MKEKLIILQHKKSHTDESFRFRDFLQYVTVPPNFSERVYVPSESKATYEVMGIYIFVTVPSKRLKTHNYLHSEAS